MWSAATVARLCAVGLAVTGAYQHARSGIAAAAPPSRNLTLTAVAGLAVGHVTLTERPTGCTVVLAPEGTVAGVDVRGAAPGTLETDLLDPLGDVPIVNAIALSGGSAYGLATATGVRQWLDERRIGYRTNAGAIVPIVPAAVLIDLWFGGNPKVRPGRDCGYRAAAAASNAPVREGNVGAGAGATVGKYFGHDVTGKGGPMKAGIGSTALSRPDGLIVAALVAVNALGDIVDPGSGNIVAGVRNANGGLADARTLVRAGRSPGAGTGENTTIGVIATNARLTKAQAKKVAQMAHDGYARAIYPIHTLADGDTIFSLATGTWRGEANEGTIGALAADAIAEAIVRAAVQAASSHGVPSARDFGSVPPRFKRGGPRVQPGTLQ
jgi:L-aminopeptidase/D-esterase-like protein